MLSAISILLRVPQPANLLSTLDRRWAAAVALNRDMGPVACLPSLGELPAAVPHALPAPRTPLTVADIPHQTGLPETRMRHALPCMAAAEGGMPMVVSLSLLHVKDAAQQQRPYAPQPWEESAQRWLRVWDLMPTRAVGLAHMKKLLVLEGAEYWASVRVEKGGLEWIIVTASRLIRQQSRGRACYGVLRDRLRFLGPVCRPCKCTPEDIPQAPAVFVEVMKKRVPAQTSGP